MNPINPRSDCCIFVSVSIVISIMKKSILTIIVVSALFLSSCQQANNTITVNKSATYYGDAVPFSNDSIRAWIKTNANGNIVSIGISFKQSAFDKLEMDSDIVFMPMLPTGMNVPVNPPWSIDHLEVHWAPKGDPKPSLYDAAYMDVLFFGVDLAAQRAVTAGPDMATANMDKKYLPADYVLDNEAEAMAGVHARDTTGKEFHGQPFDRTLAYGFYHGDLYFIEPIVAKTYLDNKPNVSPVFKQPAAFKKSGFYPTTYPSIMTARIIRSHSTVL
jgi:hypothetical protein